jgi:translation initiation factor IF-2
MEWTVGRSSPEELKRLKVRVFALAKELGIDNRDVIDFCRYLGIQVKDSALAKMTPAEREKVVANYERVKKRW